MVDRFLSCFQARSFLKSISNPKSSYCFSTFKVSSTIFLELLKNILILFYLSQYSFITFIGSFPLNTFILLISFLIKKPLLFTKFKVSTSVANSNLSLKSLFKSYWKYGVDYLKCSNCCSQSFALLAFNSVKRLLSTPFREFISNFTFGEQSVFIC